MKSDAFKQVLTVIVTSGVLIGLLVAWYSFTREVPAPEVFLEEDTEAFLTPLTSEEQQVIQPENINTMNPVAVLTTNQGVIEIELFADTMPVTAGNFQKLVEEGYYDGTKFHRVIENFMIQGGDPLTKDDSQQARWGTGGPGYAIADEHVAGELLTNTRGTISMANSGPNSGGSQFFINLVDNTFLDFDKEPAQSKHPVFGRVIAGMEIVDTIGTTETVPGDRPVEPIVLESVTIRTEG